MRNRRGWGSCGGRGFGASIYTPAIVKTLLEDMFRPFAPGGSLALRRPRRGVAGLIASLCGALTLVAPAPGQVSSEGSGGGLSDAGEASAAGADEAPQERAGGGGAVPAARQASRVAVITIEGAIDRWTSHSVSRRMKMAEEQGADAIVFELDTPGGEVGAVLEICQEIKNSPIPNTVAWVRPEAYSGGAIIALACREIVVTEFATMGDALPINPLLMATGQGLPEAERQKVLAPLLTEVVDSARRRGYSEKLVQGFVTLGVELWLVENTETGERLFVDEAEYRTLFGSDPPRTTPRVVSGAPSGGGSGASAAEAPGEGEPDPGQIAGVEDGSTDFEPASEVIDPQTTKDVTGAMSLPSRRPQLTRGDRGQWRFIEYVTDGKAPLTLTTEDLKRYGFAVRIVRNEEQLKAFFGASDLAQLDRSWSESLARFLSSLPVKGVLIVLFLLGMFIEMASPGLGVPGLVAAAALVGLVAPQMIVGAAAWWGLVAIAGGVLLVVIEIFVIPGFGIFGIAGVVTLFAGLVGVVAGPGAIFGDGARGGNDLLWSVATVLLALLTAFVGMYFIGKHYGSIPLFNRLILTDRADEDEGAGMLAAMAPEEALPVSVGDVGVVTSTLRPAGSASFGDELLDVVSESGMVERGLKVRVVSVTRYRVSVEPVEEQGAAPGESGEA